MLKLLFLCSVITFICFSSVGSIVLCGPFAHFSGCASLCPPICNQPPQYCAQVCVRGCKCNPGFILSSRYGPCIPQSFCPRRGIFCGPYAHYSNCASPCPPTCVKSPILRGCAAVCINGCKCNPGYILYTKNGPCVPESFCPNDVCGENEHYTECGTACPLTCENYLNPPKICTLQCKIGCECHKGYVRSADGRCVEPCDCPPKPSLFCPAKTSKVCIRNQNQCCTDSDCKPDERCCKENCGYECRSAETAPTEGEAVNDPGCPLG